MKMQKRKFRIGELAKKLDVERFVIRFWEKEFDIKSTRSTGGQRFYDENDLEKFILIKTLLYKQGFTIAGARKQLNQKHASSSKTIIGSTKTTFNEDTVQRLEKQNEELQDQITQLQKKLVQLRERL